ncbi:MAG: tetratricopeptide repeat protein [Planctomycetes bacterium]|nr:tetratricopeptide repeat protein [Planctomycetota bacterium]
MTDPAVHNPSPRWSQVWQLPVLVLSIALFAAGLFMAKPEAPVDQYGQELQKVQALVVAGQFDTAMATLNELARIMPTLPKPTQGQFELLAADTMYLAQRSKGWNKASNDEGIVKHYQSARDLGQTLDNQQYDRLVDSLAELGRADEGLNLLAERGEAGADARYHLLRRMITTAMAVQPLDADKAGKLIDRLLAEPKLPTSEEVWATARQAELLMKEDRVKEAVDMLLRRIARLQDDKVDALGELMVQLGLAYLDDGDMVNGERWLLRARQSLTPDDALNADVLLGLGRIRFNEGNVTEAAEHFKDVVDQFASTHAYPPALIGLAESNARLQYTDQALADFDKAVKLIGVDPATSPDLRKQLIETLTTQFDLRFAQGEYDTALQYVNLIQQLYNPPLPADILLKLATTHEQLARKGLGLADNQTEKPSDWQKLDKNQRRQVAEHFAQAADNYLAHARAVTVEDDETYGKSLWNAGVYYDKAGLHKQAIAVFGEFVTARPNDPRHLAAMFRLAQAQQATGNYDQAVALYKQLIEEHPKSPEAYASLVPLARSYILQGPTKVDLAEQVLLSVVTDHPALRPESTEYREALIELGQLYYRRGAEGDYEKAIARLDEVAERYGGEAGPTQMPELMFQLGDAYRKSVQQIDEKLAMELPPSKKAALQAERARRLDRAQQSFDGVINSFESHDPATLTDLQKLYLRNSYFYRGDCAYELGRYDGPGGAISLYEKAVQRYDKEPAALVALVQMVNSYCELKDWDKARAVNERAKVFLKRIPESAFDDPNLPMNRKHWQRWLDWTSQMAMTSADKPAP